MKKILMAMYLIGGLAMLFSCNDDSSSYPTPSDIDNLKATPGPGQITLSWTTPADENLYYVQVEYSIEATGKSYRKQVSQYASELVIDNLLQKYGEIDFTVQVFNRGNTAGPSHQITAQAEKASPTFGTPVKLTLDGKKIWTNAPFPTRPVTALVDGDITNFFHSQWQTTVAMPHYLVIDLGEEVSAIKFRSTNTNRPADSSWKTINLYTSDDYNPAQWFDGVKFINGDSVDISQAGTHKETTLTELPDGTSEVYNSEIIPLSRPSRYLWFEVTETTKGTSFFALGELEIYKCSMVVPE